jgi:type III pantothenate kinase
MNIAIDLGNTFAKIAWFEKEQLVEARYKIPFGELQLAMAQRPVQAAILSSTSHDTSEYAQWLQSQGAYSVQLTPDTPLPIGKDYDTPRALGADRVAAAAGAVSLFSRQNCLVIDMGTCITYDWVSADAVFRGGIISPGLRMRFQAMHTFTKRLPLIEKHDFTASQPIPLVGKSTQTAMQSGGFNGLLAEVEGVIHRYQTEYGDCQVLLCGGDAPFFESRLKSRIFAVPNLVLIGLNRILQHNVNLQNS